MLLTNKPEIKMLTKKLNEKEMIFGNNSCSKSMNNHRFLGIQNLRHVSQQQTKKNHKNQTLLIKI